MIDKHTKNEQFVVRFCLDIVLNVKQRFRVDYIIENRTPDKWFIVRFYWNIFLILEKTCLADNIIDEYAGDELFKQNFYSNILLTWKPTHIRIHIDEHHIANEIFVSARRFYSNAALCSITGMCTLLTSKNQAHVDSTPPVVCRLLPSTPRE